MKQILSAQQKLTLDLSLLFYILKTSTLFDRKFVIVTVFYIQITYTIHLHYTGWLENRAEKPFT